MKLKLKTDIIYKLWNQQPNLMRYISNGMEQYMPLLKDSMEYVLNTGVYLEQFQPGLYDMIMLLYGEYFNNKYSSVPVEDWIKSNPFDWCTWEDIAFAVAFKDKGKAPKRSYNYTLTDGERMALGEVLGYFTDNLGGDDELQAALQQYRNNISDQDFNRLNAVYDYIDDNYTYPKVTRKGLSSDVSVLAQFLQWIDDNDIIAYDCWDFTSASEKIRQL